MTDPLTNRHYALVTVRLPDHLQPLVLAFPEVHMAVHLITVELADGRTVSGVEVAGGEEVIRVRGSATIPFEGDDVVAVFDESSLTG